MAWLDGWEQRVLFKVESDEVAGDLVDQVALINGTWFQKTYWENMAFADARDLRITTSDGETLCPHELISFDGTAETQLFWFLAPALAGAADTTFYAYFNNSDAAVLPASWAQAVWANGYEAVYHLEETAGPIVDATGNGHDGANSGADYGETGQVGDALGFVRANSDFVKIPTFLNGLTAASFEFWMRPTTTVGDHEIIAKKTHGLGDSLVIWRDEFAAGDRFAIIINDDNGDRFFEYTANGSAPAADAWALVQITFAGDDAVRVFINDVEDASSPFAAATVGEIATDTDVVYLGNDSSEGTTKGMDGRLDEFWISNVVRSPDALSTTYDNQKTPDDFYYIDTEIETVAFDASGFFNPLFGGIITGSDEWLAWCDNVESQASVEPDGDVPPWTRHLTGAPTHVTTKGLFAMVDGADADGLNYEYASATFDYHQGTILDCRVKIDASSPAVNTGIALMISDGEAQHIVWLRDDGLNIHDFPDVAIDLSVWRRIRLAARGINCGVYVDEELIQSGYLMALTTNKKVVWGTLPTFGTGDTEWDWVRTRAMFDHEDAPEGDWIVTIGPHCATIPDVPIGSAVTITVDHSAEQIFSLAEPPIFTDNLGNSLEELGVIVRLLLDTDGEGFKAEVYNESYEGLYGYGSGYGWGYGYSYGSISPDIYYCWTRRGLIPPI